MLNINNGEQVVVPHAPKLPKQTTKPSAQTTVQKTPYQQNVSQPVDNNKWYKGDQPTKRETLGQIYQITLNDPANGQALQKKFMGLQNDQNSMFWNPYLKPTTVELGTLSNLGYDVSNINDDWYNQTAWMDDYLVRNGSTNAPSKPTKKQSNENTDAAYARFKVAGAQGQTDKAKLEMSALQDEIKFLANWKDRNYSDDEIWDYIHGDTAEFKKKYPTLSKMEDSLKPGGTIIEFNEAIPYSEDWVYGQIWAARNDGGTGNMYQDMALSALGEGNVWQDNAEIASRRKNAPYTIGGTADETLMYFNVPSYNKAWLEANRPDEHDKTAVDMWNKAWDIADFTEKAKAESEDFNKFLDRKLANATDPDAFMKKVDGWLADGYGDKKFNSLDKLDKSTQKINSLVSTSEAIPFSRYDIRKKVEEACAKNGWKPDGQQTLANNGMPAPTGQDSEANKARDKKVTDAVDAYGGDMLPSEQAVFENTPSAQYGAANVGLTDIASGDPTTLVKNNEGTVTTEYANGILSVMPDVAKNNKAKDQLAKVENEMASLAHVKESVDALGGLGEERRNSIMTAMSAPMWEDFAYYYGEFLNNPESAKDDPSTQENLDYAYRQLHQMVHANDDNLDWMDADIDTIRKEGAAWWDVMQNSDDIARYAELEATKAELEKTISGTQTAVDKYNKEQEQWDERISAYEAAGLDATGLKVAKNVTDFMLSFGEYEATIVESYNAYDQMIRGVEGGASYEDVKAGAEEADKKIQDALEGAKWVKEYMEENGIQMPDDYMRNLDRYIAKLERFSTDYDYFSLQGEADFKELAAKGREMEKSIPRGNRLDEEDENGYSLGQYMEPTEKETYYYLFAKYGSDNLDAGFQEAMKYYGHLGDPTYGVLGARTNEKYKEDAQNFVKSNPVWANVLAVLAAPVEGVAGLAYLASGIASGEFNSESPLLALGNFSQTVNEETSAKIQEKFKDSPVAKELAQGLYEILYNRGRSMANAAFTGGLKIGGKFGAVLTEIVGALPMATGAAAMSVADAKSKGADDGAALLVGATTLFMESFSEGVTRSNIMEAFGAGDEIAKRTAADLVKEWLTSSGIEEAIGETVTDAVESFVDENFVPESDHKARVAKYIEEYKLDPDNEADLKKAEALARQDEMAGLFRTFVISYLSPGTDVVTGAISDSINDFKNIREMTRSMQQRGENVSMLEVSKMYKEWKASAITEASSGGNAQEEQAPQEQQTQTEQQAPVVQPAPQRKATQADLDFLSDLGKLDAVAGSDTTTQAAAIGSMFGGDANTASGDMAKAAATLLPKLFGSMNDAVQGMKSLMIAAKSAAVDAVKVKAAVMTAALSPSSQAATVIQSPEYQNASNTEQAEMLANTAEADQGNETVKQETDAAVHDNRVASIEAEAIRNGVLDGLQPLKAALEKAGEVVRQAVENLDARVQETAAKGQALQAAVNALNENAGDVNLRRAVEGASNEVEKANESQRQYEEHLATARRAEQDAQEKYNGAKDAAMADLRQQAEAQVAQEDQQRAELAAQQAEQERVAQEKEAQAREEETEQNNFARAEADDIIANNYANASEEDKEKIRGMVSEIRKENIKTETDKVLERKNFVKRLANKYGLKIQIGDTTQGGRYLMQNASVNPETRTITLDSSATVSDAMYAILMHEVTHIAEQSGLYNELADSLLKMKYGDNTDQMNADIAAKQDLYVKGLTKLQQQGANVNPNEVNADYARQELVADLMGELMQGDEELLNRFVAESPSVARRVLDAIKSFLKKMVGIESGTLTQAQQVVDMLEKALNETNTTASANEKKFHISEADAKAIQDQYPSSAIKVSTDHTLEQIDAIEGYLGAVDDKLLSAAAKLRDDKHAYVKEIKTGKVVDRAVEEIKKITGADVSGYDHVLNRDFFLHTEKRHGINGTENHSMADLNDVARIEWVLENFDRITTDPTANNSGKGNKDANNKPMTKLRYEKALDGTVYIVEAVGENKAHALRPIEVNIKKRGAGDKTRLPKATRVSNASALDLTSETEHATPSEERVSQEGQTVKPITKDNKGNELDGEMRGGTVTKFSLSSWTEDERNRVRNDLIKSGRFTTAQVSQWISDTNGIASVIAADKGRLDFEADPTKTMLKPNAEYVKTLDASTLCAKRLLYQGTFDAIQHQLPNTPLLPEDLIDLSNLMREMGYETPCGICYVESRRRQLGKFTEQWLENYDGEYKPTIDQVTTTDGLEELRQNHPQAYQDFVNAMNKKGTMNPKVVQLRTDYRGEIRDMTPGQIQKVKDIGGLRVQSFSDFETPHLLDMAHAVLDMSAKGLTAQAYTKVPNFPWAFGDTGIKINLSLIGKGDGVDANGNLLFDDVEGMPFDEAMKLRDRYSQNVGTILVGINDDHIRAAMADPRIDFIIPFHKSGWSKTELDKMPVLNGYSDYTDSQNEKAIVGRDKKGGYKTESLDKSKRVNFQPVGENGYWDFSKSGKENAETYLRMCAEDGRLPKFSQFLVDNGDGSFSLQPDGSTDGYWKTLIDFKMYDNDGNGAPQQEVTPNINMPEAIRILDEYSLDRNGITRESNNDLPVAQPVVERYVEEYKANHPLDENRTKYSLPSQEVHEAAEKAFENSKARTEDGKLMPLYHGTSADFNVFDTSISGGKNGIQEGYGIYLTDNPEIPKQYGGRIISAYVNMERPAYADRKTIKRAELAKVIKATCEKEAQSFVDEGSYDNVKDAVRDTWISNYVYTPEYRSISDAYNAVADMILNQNDNDSDIVGELLIGQGIRDYERAMDFYHSVLTPLTGIDGIWAKWTNKQNGEVSNVLLAFDSSQIKSNEDVTYDDQGNAIPVDHRFNTKNPDIRYSLPSDAKYLSAVNHGDMDQAAEEVRKYAESKGYTDMAYHGSDAFGFTEFDMDASQGQIFVSYDEDVSETYVHGESGVRTVDEGVGRVNYEEMAGEDLANVFKSIFKKVFGEEVKDAKYVTNEELWERVRNDRESVVSPLEGATWTELERESAISYLAKELGLMGSETLFAKANTPAEVQGTLFDLYADGIIVGQSYHTINKTMTPLIANFARKEDGSYYKMDEVREMISKFADDYTIANLDEDGIETTGKNPFLTNFIKKSIAIKNIRKNTNDYGGVYQLYTRPGNQLVVNAGGAKWSQIPVPWTDQRLKTREVADYAKANGYDSVRINNVHDNGGTTGDYSAGVGDIGIFFKQDDVKSADTVTRDRNGNVIPLSERFTDSPDIRYKLPSDNILKQQLQYYMANGNRLEGENPLATTAAGEAQRAFGQGMLQESDEISERAKAIVLAQNGRGVDTNAEQLDRAIRWIRNGKQTPNSDGLYEAIQKITTNNFDYRSADGQARMVAVMGMAVAKGDTMAQITLADAFNRQGTDLGRALQARKLFRLMTPEGRIGSLQKMLQNEQERLNAKGTNTELKFSDWVYQAAAAATEEGDMQKVYQAAAQELAEQIPANWRDKIRSLRMLSMLGNPRTHIRNIVGNALFIPAVSLKNKLGAIGELGLARGERTKTLAPVLNRTVREFARQDAIAMKDELTGEAKYNEENAVQKEQKAFKGLIQAVIDFNSNALETEDWIFLKGHYRRALGGWMQANGYTAADMRAQPDLLQQGREYAKMEAQKATYRDFNKTAAVLNQISRKGGGLGFFVDAVLPFKKTPANILRRGMEYSPVGLMRSLTTDLCRLKQWNDYNNGKLNALPEKAISPTQFIDHLCSGLAGSAVLAVGALLANMGLVSCGLGDDDDKLEKEKGNQAYSLKINIAGQDFTYTMDWAAPMSMPFFVGAAIQEQLSSQKGFEIEDLINAFGNITEPVFNLSMLDGVNSLLKTSSYGDDGTNTLTQIGAKIASNYVTSYVPSLMGAIARTVDGTRRKNFVESGKGTGLAGTFRYAWEQTENKIPGLSQTNIPYRNVWGEEETSSLAERIFENFISPGYVTEYRNDPILNEMARLYEATGDNKMIPSDPGKTVTYKQQKYVLSAEQWDKYKEVRGRKAFELLSNLIDTEDYRNADTSTQLQMVKEAWTYADNTGKAEIIPGFEMESKGENPVGTIAKDAKVTSYKTEMIKALDAGDWEAYETMVQALHDVEVADSTIKEKISDTYRDKWKAAYQKATYEADPGTDEYDEAVRTMNEIEELLDMTGFSFNIYTKNGWQDKVDEKFY